MLAVALQLGYSVGPSEYSLLGLSWRYGGLVFVAALPAWVALRYRILTPLLALVLTSGYVLGMELTPPGPTFRDVAELERLDEPTGIIVVENGLYIVRYMLNASVWTVGFLFLGLVEYTARWAWGWLPTTPSDRTRIPVPASRRTAVMVATAAGVLHAIVMVWFAARLGVTASGGVEWLLYTVSALGMWVLAAVPMYLLVRHQFVAPAALLSVFVLNDVRAEFTASVDDPHAFYFGAWFVFLGILLAVAVVEYALRRASLRRRVRSLV
ncbi:hypothetical protein [Halorubellus salinus]|uniref:hypothetical protein n=1 Tax=Halorubellus salinus TaxID=755309 RepID=UPI001D08697D|nr:hypothetical protein [Halorubellus salinus]